MLQSLPEDLARTLLELAPILAYLITIERKVSRLQGQMDLLLQSLHPRTPEKKNPRVIEPGQWRTRKKTRCE